MVTRPLPAPVRAVAGVALRRAVRRWPPQLRDELAREWAAELHTISHDSSNTTAGRCWRSLGYAVSLACARGVDEHTTRGYDMRRVLRPALSLVAMPPLIAAFVIGTAMAAIAVGWETGLTRPEGATDPNLMDGQPAPPVDLAPVVALLCVIPVGLAGRWLGQRVRLPATPYLSAGATAALLVVGFGVALAASIPFESPVFGFVYGSELLGFIVWGALLPPIMVASLWFARGHRGAAVALVCLGGAVALVGGHVAGSPGAGLLLAFVQWRPSGLFSHVLLATTAFAVTYQLAQPFVTAPAPTPDMVPA